MAGETALSGKYTAYSEYKDSGIECFGELPSHWVVQSLSIATKRISVGLATSVTDSYRDKGVPIIRNMNIKEGYLDSTDMLYLDEKFAEANAGKVVYEGDVIAVHTGSNLGLACIVPEEFNNCHTFTTLIVTTNEELLNRYLTYCINSAYGKAEVHRLKFGFGKDNLNVKEFKCFYTLLPKYSEQQKIANFLDHETAKIDTLIDKQQQLITLLKEKRQAVISHAVTKGLKSNAPMRDSGVEWLGEVPAHWAVSNMDYALNAIGDVDHYMPQSVEEGIPYVMTGDLKELASSINFKNCKQVSHRDYAKLSNKIRSCRGDVIMARYATIGTASYVDVDIDFLVSYSCVTIKPDLSKVLGLYLFYYFKSDAFMQGIQSQVNTNTQGNVGVNDLKKIKVALPALAEQSAIIEYLQLKLSKLNSISVRSQAAIDLMKERRTALISAAVTGKIDVRNWQAQFTSNKNKEFAV
jgi:type I restriction enzyme S subunit